MTLTMQYMALAGKHRHQIPPTLLPAMVRERCADCGQEVLAHRLMLRQARAACRKQGQELRVVCEKCGKRNLRKADEFVFLTPDTRKLEKHFRHG